MALMAPDTLQLPHTYLCVDQSASLSYQQTLAPQGHLPLASFESVVDERERAEFDSDTAKSYARTIFARKEVVSRGVPRIFMLFSIRATSLVSRCSCLVHWFVATRLELRALVPDMVQS